MDCNNPHSIQLKIFGESLVYNRDIVQLSGSVLCPCSCEFVQITRSNDGLSLRVDLFGKRFKQLIRLIKDIVNVLHLEYCNVELHVSLSHESIPTVSFVVQPLYIINENHDGRFQSTVDDVNSIEEALRRIDMATELAQCVMSTKFNEAKLGERSFTLNSCRVFKSKLDVGQARALNQWELYDEIASELVTSEDTQRTKFVGFMSCTSFEGLSDTDEFSYAGMKAKTSANPALGGGFLCLMGSGCFFSWPSQLNDVQTAFRNRKSVDVSQTLDDSNYRRTYGGCFATSLGSLIHEMGHIFDLAHTETGLMGSDIDYVHRFFLSENFTEILPKRAVRSCQLMEQKAKTNSNSRFTKLKKPGGVFLEKYHQQKDNDMTFFEPNCLITLWNHRWFSQYQDASAMSLNSRSISLNDRTITSQHSPIKLVEIRECDKNDSVLIQFWDLSSEHVTQFKIPTNVKLKAVAVFAITSNGNIFKTDV